jgi:hypothetical protein
MVLDILYGKSLNLVLLMYCHFQVHLYLRIALSYSA